MTLVSWQPILGVRRSPAGGRAGFGESSSAIVSLLYCLTVRHGAESYPRLLHAGTEGVGIGWCALIRFYPLFMHYVNWYVNVERLGLIWMSGIVKCGGGLGVVCNSFW